MGTFRLKVPLNHSPAPSVRFSRLGPKSPLSGGWVFGLIGEALANRVRDATKAAGLGNGLSGHSDRIGMARRVSPQERPPQRSSTRADGDIVARHTKVEVASQGLTWLT